MLVKFLRNNREFFRDDCQLFFSEPQSGQIKATSHDLGPQKIQVGEHIISFGQLNQYSSWMDG